MSPKKECEEVPDDTDYSIQQQIPETPREPLRQVWSICRRPTADDRGPMTDDRQPTTNDCYLTTDDW